ncbi:DNA polymerase delta small subunit Cdc1 [Coemansia sp. RSA 2611]|nr:DNA polymerase delta small subunit Cdc1 [Coemansia sp. RSA 2702]KAJ2391913.1 DNA polymerase delta small subunit Cdc1 [Coemansia sp. RSA 2611]
MDVDGASIPRAQVALGGDPDKHQSEFLTGRRRYMQQFNELYYQRLQTLKPFVQHHAQNKWGHQGRKQPIQLTPKVLNVEGPEPTYIIGSVFIDSPAKPSTLEQVEKTHWISEPEAPGKYRVDGEAVYLEDESGRIRLVGKAIDDATLASGVVAAMMGSETADGSFEVVDMCFAGMPAQPARAFDDSQDKFVALVSGLGATAEQPVTLEMQLLAEFLAGSVGDQRRGAQIVQTVVLGSTMRLTAPPLGHTEDARANDRAPAQQLVRAVDAYLADIAATMPLTLLPGSGDPADVSLPQQPLPPSLFAQCHAFSGFRTRTNPAYFEIDGTLVLGTSGQNVDDLWHYARRGETPCQLAAQTLQWRHVAPTAPDTLWCYPFTEHDPFVVRTAPHVYAVGNQCAFDVGAAEGTDGQLTRLIMVPAFAQTQSIVLLNLRSLECSLVRIDAL